MGSASREALLRASEALNSAIGDRTGIELLSVGAQLAGSPALAAALSDATAEADAKRRLVEKLFGGLSADARNILTVAATQKWSTTDEFVDGVEELGLRAEGAKRPQLADELLSAVSVIDSDNELELHLGNKLGDADAKVRLIERLFSGKLSDEAVVVISHLAANARGRRLNRSLSNAARTIADQGGRELATITAAAPLSPSQEQRLAEYLQKTAGRPVQITTVVDPDLVGGVRVQLGDHVIDGSVRARLDGLRLQLAG